MLFLAKKIVFVKSDISRKKLFLTSIRLYNMLCMLILLRQNDMRNLHFYEVEIEQEKKYVFRTFYNVYFMYSTMFTLGSKCIWKWNLMYTVAKFWNFFGQNKKKFFELSKAVNLKLKASSTKV